MDRDLRSAGKLSPERDSLAQEAGCMKLRSRANGAGWELEVGEIW